MMRPFRIPLLLLLAPALAAAAPPKPPVAKKVPHETTLHGVTWKDDYFWLRQKDNPEVRAYLEAENAYSSAVLAPQKALADKLYQELVSHLKEDDDTVPARNGAWWYFSRQSKGKEHPSYLRERAPGGPEEVMLDVNALAEGKPFMEVEGTTVSDDGNLLGYLVDETGSEDYVLHVKDLGSGKLLPDEIQRVTSLAFTANGKALFYVTEDAVTKRPDKLWCHTLGATGPDKLIYEEKDELFDLELTRSRSRRFIVASSVSKTSTEVRYLRTDRPGDPPRLIAPREADHKVLFMGDHGDDLVLLDDGGGRRDYRVVLASAADPSPAQWRELVPHKEGTLIEEVDVFADFYVVADSEHAAQHLRIVDWKTGAARGIDMPDAAYELSPGRNHEYQTSTYRFDYESMVAPHSTFEIDVKTGERKLLKQVEVPGFDASKLEVERVFAKAADGTEIPISIVHKKGLKRDGKSPMLLYAYGSYGIPTWPGFSMSALVLLDRGVTYAIAHIRGGGEVGRKWHDQGRMMTKLNTFTDFIAAADWLVKEKYTSKDRLAIRGGSAGGLLMGAVTNMRPDLFKVVIAEVPFVDIINTMLDETLPLTAQEFIEWGNPKEKAAFDYMRAYSPYDNVAKKAYPIIMVRSSIDDPRVGYWEPTKWVARLRALKTDKNPLVLLMNMHAGHGGSSGRYEHLRDVAITYAFVLTELGVR